MLNTLRENASKKSCIVWLIPVIVLWGVVLAGFRISLILQIGLIFFFLSFSYSKRVLVILPKILLIPFFLLLAYAVFCTTSFGNLFANIKNLLILYLGVFIVMAFYAYGRVASIDVWPKIIMVYLFSTLLVTIAEIKFNLILPMSAKADKPNIANMFLGLPTGFFYNTNDFATAIVLLFSYVFTYYSSLGNKIRWLSLFIAFFIVYLTGSRGALLVFFFLPLFMCSANGKSIRWLVVLYICIIAGAFLLLGPFSEAISIVKLNPRLRRISDKIMSIYQPGGDQSINTRLKLLFYSISRYKELILGKGAGGANLFLMNANAYGVIDPHNFFLEIFIDYGLVGFTLTVIIYINSYIRLKKIAIRSRSKEVVASSVSSLVTILTFLIINIVPSSILKDWSFAWFPISMAALTFGYDQAERI